jgi:hypothetical protein
MANMYDDIWSKLKAKGTCSVAAHPVFQRRVIHAVINKKYYDEGFKLMLLEKHQTCKLSYVRTASKIVFTLTTHIHYATLTHEEL